MTLSASYEASMTLICPEYHDMEKFRLRVVAFIYLKDNNQPYFFLQEHCLSIAHCV